MIDTAIILTLYWLACQVFYMGMIEKDNPKLFDILILLTAFVSVPFIVIYHLGVIFDRYVK